METIEKLVKGGDVETQKFNIMYTVQNKLFVLYYI